jgi:hypothetical protein
MINYLASGEATAISDLSNAVNALRDRLAEEPSPEAAVINWAFVDAKSILHQPDEYFFVNHARLAWPRL